jgi:hypothetical protein
MKKNIVIIGLVIIIIILFYFLLKGDFCKVGQMKSQSGSSSLLNPAPIDVSGDVKNIGSGSTNNSSTVKKSGIRGSVIFKSCPGVMQEGVDPVCTNYGGELSLYVKNNTGGIVKEIVSGKDGKFEIELPGGDYSIGHTKAKNETYSVSDVKVKVTTGSFSNTNINVTVMNQ